MNDLPVFKTDMNLYLQHIPFIAFPKGHLPFFENKNHQSACSRHFDHVAVLTLLLQVRLIRASLTTSIKLTPYTASLANHATGNSFTFTPF
jgi:hypothetical protein